MLILAIDPGQTGGFAWKREKQIYTQLMPDTPKDIIESLRKIAQTADGYETLICYIERVGGYMPGNSGPASVKFAKHTGHLEMALIALNISYREVLPAVWMKQFIGVQKYPPSMKAGQKKTLRKNKIKQKAQALYPDIKVTLAISDALGILNYAIEKNN